MEDAPRLEMPSMSCSSEREVVAGPAGRPDDAVPVRPLDAEGAVPAEQPLPFLDFLVTIYVVAYIIRTCEYALSVAPTNLIRIITGKSKGSVAWLGARTVQPTALGCEYAVEFIGYCSITLGRIFHIVLAVEKLIQSSWLSTIRTMMEQLTVGSLKWSVVGGDFVNGSCLASNYPTDIECYVTTVTSLSGHMDIVHIRKTSRLLRRLMLHGLHCQLAHVTKR
jgi:hypothetical protein